MPDIPSCSNLKMRPLCQTLSDAFDMTRNAPRTSHPSSNDLYIPWVVDKSWLIQESPGYKPDWFVEIRSFVVKKSDISLYNRHSNIFPHSGKSEIGDCSSFFCELEHHLLCSIPVEKSHFLNLIWKSFQGVYVCDVLRDLVPFV